MFRSKRRQRRCALGWVLVSIASPNAFAAALPGQWSLFADFSHNGVPVGTYPTLAVSSATHELYASYEFNGQTPVGSLGKVWRCDLNDPAHAFNLLPQTGFTLPPPGGSNPQCTSFTMTVNSAGEPIVGCITPAATVVNDKIFRFDKATQTWKVPTLSVAAGGQVPSQMPNEAMYNLVTAADGTIWGGGQFANIFKSTDGGKSFSIIDETTFLKNTDPNFFPTVSNGQDYAGAVYGINVNNANGYVYAGTESAGGIYSPDGGKTWHPVDNDYTNPNSPMRRITNAGNVAGVGITKDGKIVYQGTHGYDATPTDDGVHLWYVDPVAHTVQSALGIPANMLGGQSVDQIVTTASGQMFFQSNTNSFNADGTPGIGGIYTSADGLHWSQFNDGIQELLKDGNGNVIVDFNGHGDTGAFAVLGDQVFFETANGKIFTYTVAPEPTSVAMLGIVGSLAAASGRNVHRRGCNRE